MSDKANGCSLTSEVVILLSEEDTKKYAEQYVCVPNFASVEVIAANKDPVLAYQIAKDKGYENPVLFFVPHQCKIFIFEHETKKMHRRS